MTQIEIQKLQIGDRVTVNYFPHRAALVHGKVSLVQWCKHDGKDVVYNVNVLIDGDTKPYGVNLEKIQLEK